MFNDQNPQGGFFLPQDQQTNAQNPYGGQNQNQNMFAPGPQGLGGHGGFMGGQQNVGQNIYGNQNNAGGGQYSNAPAQDRRKAKVFTPVTVKMVANSQPRPDDVCEYDGDPINDIILCGRILRRIEEPMRTQFEINDNTGTFYVLFYHKGENQVPTALRNFNYEQFAYVKVYGNIRVFKEEKAIVGTHIKRIEKFDELTNHFLAVYVSHCIRKKGVLKPRELQMAQGDRGINMNNMQNYQGGNRSHDNGGANQMQIDNNSNGGMNRSGHGSGSENHIGNKMFDVRRAILELMRQMTQQEKFVNKNQLYQLLKDKVDMQNFEREMDKMMNDGEICTAFDQNHFCLTN